MGEIFQPGEFGGIAPRRRSDSGAAIPLAHAAHVGVATPARHVAPVTPHNGATATSGHAAAIRAIGRDTPSDAAAATKAEPDQSPSGVASRRIPSIPVCILLAGGLKPSPLMAASGLSVLDLLVAPATTVLDLWVQKLAALAAADGADGHGGTQVRILHCSNTPPPRQAPPPPDAGLRMTIREDPQSYRGPAGIARDACADDPADTPILLAEAGRLLMCDLAPLVEQHFRAGADITVAANDDGTPAGLYIARRETLGIVPGRGFMDLKEQWLSRAMESGKRVFVHRLAGPGALPLRTRLQYLRACVPLGPLWNAVPGQWPGMVLRQAALDAGTAARSLISPAASVHPGALVTQSVVMQEAVVEEGAVVARSIVCPGARIACGQEVLDAVVVADRVQFDDGRTRRGSQESRG